MRGLYGYRIGRLVTLETESQTGRAQRLFCEEQRAGSVQAGGEAGLSG